MRLIGYGGMLTESFVAVMALITASIIEPAPVLHPQRAAAPDRRHRGHRRRYVNGLGLSVPRDRRADPGAATERRREVDRVAHRRRTDAGRRHVGGAAPGIRRRRSQGLLVSLRDHVRGAVHPDHRRRRHPGRTLHDPGPARPVIPPFTRDRSPGPPTSSARALACAAGATSSIRASSIPSAASGPCGRCSASSNQMLAAIALDPLHRRPVQDERERFALVTVVPAAWLVVCTVTAGLEKVSRPIRRSASSPMRPI